MLFIYKKYSINEMLTRKENLNPIKDTILKWSVLQSILRDVTHLLHRVVFVNPF